MHRLLMEAKVGMNVIESESRRLVKERMSGPTGHRLLIGLEEEPNEPGFGTEEKLREELHCWRDPAMIRRLVGIRLKVVKSQLAKARKVLGEELRLLAATQARPKMGLAWQEVKDIKKRVWRQEHARVQRKVQHLTKKATNCASHKSCREMEALQAQRKKESRLAHSGEVERLSCANQVGEGVPGEGVCHGQGGSGEPFQDGATPTPHLDPNSLLSAKYFSRPEDLARLEEEKVKLLHLAQGYNIGWKTTEAGVEDLDRDRDIATYGSVCLSEDEKDLLRLGPDFMIVSSLDEKEMQVEASVCMTKIRWARRKKGSNNMTEAQAAEEIEPLMVEEETLAEALEVEMRDVISNDGKEIDMRRQRPTDMKNGREVKMPGPAPPVVEAENTVRLGVWQAAFNQHRMEHCRKNGEQPVSPTTTGTQDTQ